MQRFQSLQHTADTECWPGLTVSARPGRHVLWCVEHVMFTYSLAHSVQCWPRDVVCSTSLVLMPLSAGCQQMHCWQHHGCLMWHQALYLGVHLAPGNHWAVAWANQLL